MHAKLSRIIFYKKFKQFYYKFRTFVVVTGHIEKVVNPGRRLMLVVVVT
jgi:hypothetical protein